MIGTSLPNGWEWRKARDCMDVRDGTHDSPTYIESGYPLVTSKNLVNGKIDFSTCSFISKNDYDAISKRSAVNDGDILYAMIGTIGNPVIVKKQSEFAIKNVALFKFNNVNTLNKYIYYFLNSELTKKQFDSNSRGGTQKFVSLTNIRELKIPLPPLAEQQKIAAILDAADSLRQKDQQLVERYTALSQSLFLEMFGDPVTNPMGWKKARISELGTVSTGSTPPSAKNNMFGGKIPFVTPSDLDTENSYKRTVTEEGAVNSRQVKAGALFVCCIGATIGKIRMAKDICTFNQQINAIQWADKINPLFGLHIFGFLRNEVIRRAISTTLPILKKSEFSKIECTVPPIALQNQFAESIKLIEAQKQQAQASLQKSEALFNSLLQQAFTGALTAKIAAYPPQAGGRLGWGLKVVSIHPHPNPPPIMGRGYVL